MSAHALRIIEPGAALAPRRQARESATQDKAIQTSAALDERVTAYLEARLAAWLAGDAATTVKVWAEEQAPLPVLVSLDRAARMVDMHRNTVEKLVYSGQLPSVMVGARRLIRVRDLHAWAESLECA